MDWLTYIVVLIIAFIAYICKCLTGGEILKEGGDAEQNAVYREYKQFREKKTKPTFEEFCYPDTYSIQKHQAFAGEYMAPKNHHNSMLIFHKIGSGKTCLSIQIAERWKRQGKPLVVMPASLIPGYRNELRSKCADDKYLTDSERNKLRDATPGSEEYNAIIEESDRRIDEHYQIYSYNKFATLGRVKAPIIIIDEVQNVNNPDGVYYRALVNWIEKNPEVPVVVMSATPIFDSVEDLHGIARLLRIEADEITPKNVGELFAGKVSFYAGAPSYTFPKTYVQVKKCVMSRHQARWYKSDVEAELKKYGNIALNEVSDSFYIKSRQRANIVYPNGLTGKAGLESLTPSIIRNSLSTYSTKFDAVVKKLKKNQLSFVFTNFTEASGIAALTKCLGAFGWSDFFVDGPGPKRYAVWSGDQSAKEKDLIRATFNSPANDNASQIQVIIGSPSIKEGVSLMRIRQVHVLETYWNHSRLEQIYGRAVRYCSHKTLPKRERDVTIYLYAAVAPGAREITPLESIDLHMLGVADKKRDAASPYVKALMNIAVDKYLYYGKGEAESQVDG